MNAPSPLRPLCALAAVALFATEAAAWWPFDDSTTPSSGVAWLNEPSEALAAARSRGVPILAYVSGAHCGHCRRMERDTWASAAVRRAVDAGYVPLRLDAATHGAAMASLRVTAYPTTLVIDPSGVVTRTAAGYRSPAELLAWLEAGRGLAAAR